MKNKPGTCETDDCLISHHLYIYHCKKGKRSVISGRKLSIGKKSASFQLLVGGPAYSLLSIAKWRGGISSINLESPFPSISGAHFRV